VSHDPPGIDRRAFLQALAALGFVPGCAPVPRGPWVVSARDASDGSHGLVAAGPEGLVLDLQTAFRGHGAACDPAHPGRIALFARRPGQEAVIVDLVGGRELARLTCPDGLRMQGHGAFDTNRGLLYVALADERTADGVLGVWDTQTWAWVDALPSHGMGPHEIRLMPDGSTLAVANGGLLTRPESGREVLNLDTMVASLAMVDLDSGALVDEAHFPVDKASVRHLDVADDGTVAVGVQIQREAVGHDGRLPLVGSYRQGEGLTVFEAPPLLDTMDDYVGSVAISHRARVVATSSPRGSIVLFWDLDTGVLRGQHDLADVCGLAVDEAAGRFLLSNSLGHLRSIDVSTLVERTEDRQHFDDVRWDNHMTLVMI